MDCGKNKKYDIKERSFDFGVAILKFISKLPKNIIGFEIGKQLLRSGTSIGANLEEATGARTKKEFINIVNISKREARESNYWLRLLAESKLITNKDIESLLSESNELIGILTTIVRKTEEKMFNIS